MGRIGERIKVLRKSLGLSQRDVSAKVGVTQEAISQLERFPDRVPSSDTLQQLAKFFQVDAEWLLTGKGQQNPITSLTPEEREFILLFRQVSPAGRAYISGRLRDVYRDEYGGREPPDGEGDGDRPSPDYPH